ncbi:enoyl-CoA hydratase/isomerase family protein [Rhodococcus sp. HM1]|uniref:enoyl-CoA hydratase/isomerase family protein n=1 Tax=unclassified Rhodococcus (in: high G+C Gram-positive bacteria) TaxID=192944 RepID=UPI0018CEC8BA|nr:MULTISPECIES: enoyl-CoA hydratase/isomerase family protein [unclassified Rhodococcus (in: high G+C Gram-positive bacteria)]MBH0121253.1 enoyl-CoA hydratase/isomerase family protein [Rhodococcus sp. CX]MCK8671266.1 enoyl-CoA hydratase/isomerase family protein [Rhodococcus sp. HM1]
MNDASSDLSVELVQHVATVRIHRAPNNFFDTDLIGALADTFEELSQDAQCRAIVLCSEGKHFCAGANFQGGNRKPRYDADRVHTYDQAQRLFEQPLPVVAAIQGAAIGGGLGLALAADFRIGSSRARFSANFAAIGFHHGFGLTETLPAVTGQQRALEMLMTGRNVGAEEAMNIGLLDRLVPESEIGSAAIEFATEIASAAPLAVRAIRATMRGDLADRVKAAMAREKVEQQILSETQDWTEGVKAAAERRRPNFVGC